MGGEDLVRQPSELSIKLYLPNKSLSFDKLGFMFSVVGDSGGSARSGEGELWVVP